MQRRPLKTGTTTDAKSFAKDSFVNFAASLGYGASNLTSGSGYTQNPITRNHTLLEFCYRGSWLVRQVVDCVADDMTREGLSVESEIPPDKIDKLLQYWDDRLLWQRLNETLKWSRLYGGCIAVIMIDGQKPETPLRIDTVGKDQFKGLHVLDRWMVWPHLEDPVTELGDQYGLPKYYEVVSDAKAVPHMKVHYSRCIRMDGIQLPYWQRVAENMWGLSVIEPLYDRLIAFDSTTQGAAQLVYRAHLRTLKIEKLRELIAFGGEGYQGVLEQLKMIRLMQSNEGLTVIDSTDEFETHSYAFGGLSDLLVQFAQQLSGAAGIPLVRLFGQSPAGLNATGDADVRNYYDFLKSQQEARMRRPVTLLLDLCHRSLFGTPLPDGFDFSFNPLWQSTDEQKATMATAYTNAVNAAFENGVVSMPVALKELRQLSKVTGLFSNITDEDIKGAEELPPPHEMAMQEMQQQQEAHEQGMEVGEHSMQMEKQQNMGETAQRNRAAGVHFGSKEDVKSHFVGDEQPLEVHGISVTGNPDNQRIGEIDCLVGDDRDSQAVWIVEHQSPETNEFDRYQVMLCFPDRDAAVDGYKARYGDSLGAIKRTNITGLKQIVAEWPVAESRQRLNGG